MADDTLSQLKRALAAIKELRSRLDTVERARTEPIAIIGMGCRFPGGASSPDAYWQLLANGVDGISETPKDRWDIDALYDPDPDAIGKITSRWGGYLDRVDQFDPAFFGISPKEAALMDPQQRLLLEVAWESLEDAGQTIENLQGSLTGVFVGLHSQSSDYYWMQVRDSQAIDTYTGTGTSHSVVGGRLSYLFDWRGPNVTLDTACSSSLTAVHLAVQSLRNRESDMALAGGVNIMLSPEFTIAASRMHMLSPDGRCKTFDQQANGFVRGEGCGVIVLKRLSDALAAGDNVLALIRGSAVNQDGKSNGLTAPNGIAQQAVIRAALSNGGVKPEEVTYIEAHGTGTALGDPIEVEALANVFTSTDPARSRCYLGSAKSNIGHLEGAAGIAGIIKTVLSMQNRAVPPLLHFSSLNPHITLDNTPFKITTQLEVWSAGDMPRIAGVSSFGWSGTNAHIILEEAPERETVTDAQPERPVHITALSAKSDLALRQLAHRYLAFLHAHPNTSLPDFAFTTTTGRSAFAYRAAIPARSTDSLCDKLLALAEGQSLTGLHSAWVDEDAPLKLAFLFTGQGSQYVGMGRQLYDTQPVFRHAIDQCAALLEPELPLQLLSVLFADTDPSTHLNDTRYTQPALFALEYALAMLWQAWGVVPSAVMGHSVGEYVAAVIAGVFSLQDGLKLIAARGRLMSALPAGGEMVAIFAPEADVKEALQGYETRVSIAALNTPEQIVISGEGEAIQSVVSTFQSAGVKTRPLVVSHAFHSPLMEPMLAEFEQVAAQVQYTPPKLRLISNVTGAVAGAEVATAVYWRQHVREAVRFSSAIQTLDSLGYGVYLEVGAGTTLLGMGQQTLPDQTHTWLPSLRKGRDDWEVMSDTVSSLFVHGIPIDWQAFDAVYPRQRIPLPPYPFQYQRYWMETSPTQVNWPEGHPLLGHRLPQLAQLPGAMVWEKHPDFGFWRIVRDQYLDSSDAVYEAIISAAAKSYYDSVGYFITQCVVHEPLIEAETVNLQTILEGDGTGAAVQIYTRVNEQLPWSLKATGRVEVDPVQTDWLYDVSWLPQNPPILPAKTDTGHWLIFSDQSGVSEKLVSLLMQHGEIPRLVFAGNQFQPLENGNFIVDPRSPNDLNHLLQALGETSILSLKGVLYLWALDLPMTSELNAHSFEQAQIFSSNVPLFLLQSFAARSWSSYPRIWLLTQTAQSVVSTDASVLALAQAPLWGFGRTLAGEHPEFWGGLIDLPPNVNDVTLENLFTELQSSDLDDQIAYRDAQRYVLRLKKSNHLEPSSHLPAIQPDVTYLVTGGLGGVGLEVARGLVKQGARHLVLMGRRGASEAVRPVIAELESMGVKVWIASADVANRDDLERVLTEIDRTMPPLRGIFHAAGVTDDGVLMQQDADRFQRVMLPKITGTWNLHTLTQDIPLDYFVLFSSVAALFGFGGQGNYAAANTFMDSFAYFRRSLGLAAVSINWGVWDELGLATGLGSYFKSLGLNVMNPDDALATMSYLLRTPAVNNLIASVDWQTLLQLKGNGRSSGLFIGLKDELSDASRSTVSSTISLRDELQALPQTEQWNRLLNYVREVAALVLGFDARTLDIRMGFFKIGMDSLMSVQLRNRLQVGLNCVLPPTIALEYPTVEGLARYIYEEVLGLAQSNVPAAVEQSEVVSSAQLDTLSQDELESLLDDELAAIDDLIGDDE